MNTAGSTDKQPQAACCGCLVLIVLVVILGMIFSPGEKSDERDWALEAYFVAQDFVTTQLKAPGTAKFPLSTDPAVTITRRDNGAWLISGYVDAQNSFGALIRTRYICSVKEGSGGKWRLEEFSFLR